MSIKVRNGFDIDLILSRLSQERTVNDDGSITAGLGVLDEYESYLRTAVEAEGKTNSFVRNVVRKAIYQEQNLTKDSFIRNCNKFASTMLQRDNQKFKVVFPIFGNRGIVSGRKKWGDVFIKFDISPHTAFARRAKGARIEQLQKARTNTSRIIGDLGDLPLAVCSVQAINAGDAFEQAESAISKELGLYSLVSSRGKFIVSNIPDQPINTILFAPYMTVHKSDGSISADMYWYNQWPDHASEKIWSQKDIFQIRSNVEKVRARLQKLPWRGIAELALARHYSAFSQCDLEASFLDGWRLLEAIGGDPRENSERLVKRAAWFFEDRERQYQIGLHLMHRRNLISHGRPVKDDNNEQLAFQMKTFLTPLFHAFLTNPYNFKNINEFWSFCDLTTDRDKRLRSAYLLKCGAKFRREG